MGSDPQGAITRGCSSRERGQDELNVLSGRSALAARPGARGRARGPRGARAGEARLRARPDRGTPAPPRRPRPGEAARAGTGALLAARRLRGAARRCGAPHPRDRSHHHRAKGSTRGRRHRPGPRRGARQSPRPAALHPAPCGVRWSDERQVATAQRLGQEAGERRVVYLATRLDRVPAGTGSRPWRTPSMPRSICSPRTCANASPWNGSPPSSSPEDGSSWWPRCRRRKDLEPASSRPLRGSCLSSACVQRRPRTPAARTPSSSPASSSPTSAGPASSRSASRGCPSAGATARAGRRTRSFAPATTAWACPIPASWSPCGNRRGSSS